MGSSAVKRDSPEEFYETDFKNLTLALGNLAYTSGWLLQQALISVDSLSRVVMDNRQALEFMLIEQGGMCAVLNGICHLYSNNSMFPEKDIKALHAQVKWFYSLHMGNLSPPTVWEMARHVFFFHFKGHTSCTWGYSNLAHGDLQTCKFQNPATSENNDDHAGDTDDGGD